MYRDRTGRLTSLFSLIECGVSVLGLDIDPRLRGLVNEGQMPFAEPGYDELVARKEYVTDDASLISRCDAVVITVGTPLHTHIETDLDQIRGMTNMGRIFGAAAGLSQKYGSTRYHNVRA